MSPITTHPSGQLTSIWQSIFAGSDNKNNVFSIFYCIILFQVLLLTVVGLQSSIPLERLFRDTIIVAEEYPGCCHVYDGLISNLGILLWWTAASVTGFAALILVSLSGRRYEFLALAMATVFSAWLALDDLFMLHETVLPRIGLPQPATYALYGIIACAYIALSWRVVLMAAPKFLLMAISMLGMSISIDMLSEYDMGAITHWLQTNPRTEFLIEDGLKFLGIGFWCCLHMAAAMNVVTNATASKFQNGGRI